MAPIHLQPWREYIYDVRQGSGSSAFGRRGILASGVDAGNFRTPVDLQHPAKISAVTDIGLTLVLRSTRGDLQ
jgi:hypothetical protein